MKLGLLALVLILGVAASVVLVINRNKLEINKTENAFVKLNVEDLPEHGVSFVTASDLAFNGLQPNLSGSAYSYAVLLKNTSSRAIVGYAVKWECFDNTSKRIISNDRNLTHIVSWVFLHGDESERRVAMKRSNEIIMPQSIWLISFDSAPRLIKTLNAPVGRTNPEEGGTTETIKNCANVKVIADGVFFDDGEFVGPDSTGFFTTVKSQMDARYEILRGVQSELKLGKKSDEIFKGLEKIRDHEGVKLGEHPTADESRSYFRNMFARDVLGKKEALGTEKTIEDIHLQLSKPWVQLRKL